MSNRVNYEIVNNGGILSVSIQAVAADADPDKVTDLANELNTVIMPILDRFKEGVTMELKSFVASLMTYQTA